MESKPHRGGALGRLKRSLSDFRARKAHGARATGLGFLIADRIDYLDPAKWDAATRDAGTFLRRDILRVIEEHGPENIEPRYALIFRGQAPVAALAAQIVTVTGDRLHREKSVARAQKSGLLRKLLSPAVRTASAGLRERMLVAGNLLSWGFHGIAFAPGEDPASLWPAITEILYRIRRAERLSGQADFVMIKDVTPQQHHAGALRRFSYRVLETEPNMVLSLDPAWRTYDDYLSALDAKHRRAARDQVKKLTGAGCTVESFTGALEEHSSRLHELYLAVQGNAPVRLVTVRESYFAALARAAGDDFRCTLVRRGPQVIGFVTSVRDGDTAIGYYIGFDRSAAAEGLPIYLRLMHATVADAIHWRCSRLSLGRTALEPKAGLGAKPEPMSVWVRHRVAPMNWLLRGVAGAVPHAEAPERDPFKSVETRQAG